VPGPERSIAASIVLQFYSWKLI